MSEIVPFSPPSRQRPAIPESAFCVRPCLAVRPIHQYRTGLAARVRGLTGGGTASTQAKRVLEELHTLDVFLATHYRNCGCVGRRGVAS